MFLLLLGCTDPAPSHSVALLDFAGETPKNVVVWSIDTLRRDLVGRYAATDDTPFLDGFLASSVVMDDHASCGNWTVASFVCLYTGASALDLGFEPDSGDPAVPDMPPLLDTWPVAFRAQGYDTALVSANPFVSAKKDWPLGAGYQEVWLEANVRGELLVDQALAMGEDLSSPSLLQVHFMDTHEPYEAPEEFQEPAPEITYDLSDPTEIQRLEQDWINLDAQEQADIQDALAAGHRGEIRYLDHQLERLWQGLEDQGALADTLILVVSDHGQQHLERARWSHGNHLHQEETGAIAAIWAQNLSPASWSGLTVHQDVAATLNALYGLGLESVTGLPLGEADATRPRMQQYYRNHLSETTAVPRQSLETEEWRLSYAWDGVQRLHHRQEDPAELTDQLELADPQVLVDLWDQLQPQVDRLQETLLPHHTPEGSGP